MKPAPINAASLPAKLLADACNLPQVFQEVAVGVLIVDRDLRCLQVNAEMASINGKPVAEHAGKTLQQVNARVALALEPVLRSVIREGEAQAQGAEVFVSSAAVASEAACFLVGCHPLKDEQGGVLGALALVRDISEQKLKDAAQDELLKFEELLSDLSASFINVPVAEVDRKIEQGLQKIVEVLGFDRSTIWQYSPDGRLHSTHSYAISGISKPPSIVDSQRLPVWISMSLRGEVFSVSDVADLSEEFWREKEYCKALGGIKSFLFIPLNVGGTVVGLLAFASYRVKKSWPAPLVQRLRIFWEIFGNALERKRADQAIQKALAEIRTLKDRLEAENLYLRDQIEVDYKYEEIIGQSAAIRRVLQQVEQVAHTDSTVLILGETGTGKELMARAIHNLSGRKSRAMIKLNCAALPATLIEAELFGREKGAYTGAVAAQIGRFEAANGSTIFLDEIGELPLELQSKLLRVLQDSQFERLGSPKPISVDVRVIAATNRDLAREVKEGRFRQDLYYRLNVFPISVPPLRERREDISALVRAAVQEFGKLFGKAIEMIPKKNMDALESYHWPGNVRELRNLVERGMILSNGTTLVVDLPESAAPAASTPSSFEEMELQHILRTMELTGWRVRGKNGAAEILKMKPNTLDAKMKKLGIVRKYPPYKA